MTDVGSDSSDCDFAEATVEADVDKVDKRGDATVASEPTREAMEWLMRNPQMPSHTPYSPPRRASLSLPVSPEIPSAPFRRASLLESSSSREHHSPFQEMTLKVSDGPATAVKSTRCWSGTDHPRQINSGTESAKDNRIDLHSKHVQLEKRVVRLHERVLDLLGKSRGSSNKLELVHSFVCIVEEALGTAEARYETGCAEENMCCPAGEKNDLTTFPDSSDFSEGLWSAEVASQLCPTELQSTPTHLSCELPSDVVARFMNGAVVPCDLTRARSIAAIRRSVAIAVCAHPRRVRLYCGKDELFDSSSLSTLRDNPDISVITLDGIDRFRVYCRVRPLTSDERQDGETQFIEQLDPWTLNVKTVGTWKFDRVFVPGTPEDIFDSCKDIVRDAFGGNQRSIFTYGQTRTGKSHTMFGVDGIFQRICREIFHTVDCNRQQVTATIMCSAIEMIGSELVDSLHRSCGGTTSKLNIREERTGRVIIEHLTEEEVSTEAGMIDVLERGRKQLKTLGMGPSQRSASHFMFLVKVIIVNRQTQERLAGQIRLCDLASPVRLHKAESSSDDITKTSIEINKSLTALGNVFKAIAEERQLVPYRNHKVAQVCISGSANLIFIAACSPAERDWEDTDLTFKYALRAKFGRLNGEI